MPVLNENIMSLLNEPANTAPKGKYDESQQAVIDDDRYPFYTLAGAGAGKTWTMLGKAERYAKDPNCNGKVLILCFNKGIKEELEDKLKKSGLWKLGIEAKTLHGLGYQFVRQTYGLDGVKILATSWNRHLYFGAPKQAKYKKYPGLLKKFIEELGIPKVDDLKSHKVVAKFTDLVRVTLGYIASSGLKTDLRQISTFAPLKEVFATVCKNFTADQKIIDLYSSHLTEELFYALDGRRKEIKLDKFLYKILYTRNFAAFVHANIWELASGRDLFGNFANPKLDSWTLEMPLAFALHAGVDVITKFDYKEFSEKILNPALGKIAVTDIEQQVTEWQELDYDSMLSLSAYSIMHLKMRSDYYAVLVDEAQDLMLFDWYLTCEIFPKYLITDNEPRLFFVGDILQCINRWRFASVERFRHYASEHANGQLIYSYRCPQRIVDGANQIKEKSASNIKQEKEYKFISASKYQPGFAMCWHHDNHPSALDMLLKSTSVELEEVTVLGRTNSDLLCWQFWAILNDIPIDEILLNRGELSSKEIKFMLALLAVVEDAPTDDRYKLAAAYLTGIKDSLYIHTLGIKLASGSSVEEVIARECLNFEKDLDELTEDEKAELRHGISTIKMLLNWYHTDTFGLRTKFTSLIVREELNVNKAKRGLTLSTIHRYKGREKEVILISSSAWGKIVRRSTTFDEIEGEFALAYVAYTRAKKAVFLCGDLHPELHAVVDNLRLGIGDFR